MGITTNNQVYLVSAELLKGSNFASIYPKARAVFKAIEKKTKRKAYIRSAYFQKRKVFFDYFWIHMSQKNVSIQRRRLKYFSAGIELVEKCRQKPINVANENKGNEMLHRFHGRLRSGEVFATQIKENTKTHKLNFMSVFDLKK